MKSATPNPQPRYATRYEIVATAPGHDPVIVGYTPRKSRHGLLAVLRRRGEELIQHFGIGEEVEVEVRARPLPHARFSNGLTVGFSGRTEREAATLARIAAEEASR